MTGQTWRASAPSNIALIKYMGKTDASANRPTNASISYTLDHLRTIVELELLPAETIDRWECLLSDEGRRLEPIALSEKGQARFLAHLARVKERFGFRGAFLVRSANDFPSDCGLASSASSFAALTRAAVLALSELTGHSLDDRQAADLSRQGSGSSCRSFFGPWSIWGAEGAGGVPELADVRLLHQVIVVDEEIKAVSSSQAHVRVATSRLFAGRPERAGERLSQLVQALAKPDSWREAFELCWAEFWDMHALFETSRPSFGYMTAGSLEVLRAVRARTWDGARATGPLITMDAGPNIHLLYRPDDEGRAMMREIAELCGGRFKVFSSAEVRA